MKARILTAIITVNLLFAGAVSVPAEDKEGSSGSKPAKESLGPVAESITPYRPTNRDPFKRTPKPKVIRNLKGGVPQPARVLGFPTLDMRRAEFRQKVQQSESMARPGPDPVSQYLVGEVEITGVFRDDHGFGAFLRAQPTGTMFFVRNGSKLYNGEVTRIVGDEGDGASRVQFREVTYIENNGKQTPQEKVVIKVPTASASRR
ncbi:MAG TPA: hypothetical protein VKM94_05500 [Blastocatellia bacterium]|nr:hypothetical protein [Blastocatellia bacterium]